MDHAIAEGTLVRTHVMRWTWQLVAPADLRWLLPLVAPKLVSRAARRFERLALGPAIFRHSHAAIERALAGGRHLTRREIGEALRAAGIELNGSRLSHLLGHAELHGLICSGPPHDKQATSALLAGRAPNQAAAMTRDQALHELARRYFRSRGPATVADFVWWSGLAPADARAGIEAVRADLEVETIDRTSYWFDRNAVRVADAALARAYLLPAFDELLIAYRDRAAMVDAAHARRLNAGGGMLRPCVVIAGRLVGIWRRSLRRDVVTIEVTPFETAARRDRDPIAAAAHRYADFLGRDLKLVFTGRLRAPSNR